MTDDIQSPQPANKQIIDYSANPERYRTLKNGAIYDNERKKIVAAPPLERQPISQVNASAMASLRWEQAIKASRQGIKDVSGTKSSYSAWGKAMGKLYDDAMQPGISMAKVKGLELVGRAADLLPDRRQDPNSAPSGAQITVNLSQDALIGLFSAITGRNDSPD
jgi:hypothetical protein